MTCFAIVFFLPLQSILQQQIIIRKTANAATLSVSTRFKFVCTIPREDFIVSPPETSLHRGKQRYGFTRKASRSVKQWYRFKIDDTIPILSHGITQ